MMKKLGFGLMRLPMQGEDVDIEQTKTMVDMLAAVGAQGKTLVVLPAVNAFVVKSLANIAKVSSTLSSTLNVYDILNAETLVVDQAAIKMIEEVYA